jgi:alcohol dehydrogenase class IV
MPDPVRANSGADALAHAVEAAVSRKAGPLTVRLAFAAAQDILQALPQSLSESRGDRLPARETMQAAASVAGMAITSSSAGLSHAMDQVGPAFGLPHGLVCGVLLPHTMRFHSPCPEYATLARRLGHSGSEEDLCASLAAAIWDLFRATGMPAGFAAAGLGRVEFERALPGLVEETLRSPAALLSPACPQPSKVEAIYERAYSGTHPLD